MGKAAVSINQIIDLYEFLSRTETTSYDEIGKRFGISTRATIKRYLDYVEIIFNVHVERPRKPRSVRLVRTGLHHSRMTVRAQDAVVDVLIDDNQKGWVRDQMFMILAEYGNPYTAKEHLDRYKEIKKF